MKRKHKLLVYLGITLIAFLYFFVTAPTINPLYPDGAFFWAVLVTIYLAAGQLMKGGLKVSAAGGLFSIDFDKEKKVKFKKWAVVTIIVIWAIYFLTMLISSPLFFYKAYRDQLPKAEQVEFSSDMQTLDISQVPVVDQALATQLASKKLGENAALGSQVELGEPTIQEVDGELVWVVPLHHSGFFKWITNLEGSKGYIKISATNLQDMEYVGDYNIKIQPNCYLLDDLERHVRFGPGAWTGITDYSFELDDTGRPYWVVTTYKNLRGFALPEADGILLVDAQTGDIQQYGMDEIPEWVDRVQPEDFIINQINNQGEYVHGIFNFANTDKTKTSDGHAIIYNGGDCYLFTGLTSVGSDESAIGFMMVDMVNKQPVFYSMSGATEEAAQRSAEGKVQNYGYRASFPIILNISNQPTYFMTLKDSSSQLVKQYAMVSVKNLNVVGVGDTPKAAQDDYLKAMQEIGTSIDLGQGDAAPAETKEMTGTVERISWNTSGDTVEYTMILSDHYDQIFTVPSEVSAELPVTQPGDQISITYEADGIGAVYRVTQFDNLWIGEGAPAKRQTQQTSQTENEIQN
ncbi:MAG: hypothetical protein ACOX60_00555 [Massiliimalia sp.]|jgi:hypothetical protein